MSISRAKGFNAALHGGEWLTPLHTPATCFPPPGKKPQHPLNRRLCGPQSWFGNFGEEENLLSIPEFEPRTVQPIA